MEKGVVIFSSVHEEKAIEIIRFTRVSCLSPPPNNYSFIYYQKLLGREESYRTIVRNLLPHYSDRVSTVIETRKAHTERKLRTKGCRTRQFEQHK